MNNTSFWRNPRSLAFPAPICFSALMLCEARAEGAAARQYRSALSILGVSEVRAAASTDIAQR